MRSTSCDLINFYEIIPKHLRRTYHNPNYKKHLLTIPFRAVVIGPSGSGKTQLALNIIHKMSNTFEKLVICCKSKSEPLYEYIEASLGPLVEFHENGEVPDLDSLQDYPQTLVIFDDLVGEKDQSMIQQYYVRGRKLGKGISMLYLTQSYFKVPKLIRLQANYFFIKKVSSLRDLKIILSEFGLDANPKQIIEFYRYATHDPLSFLLIDIDKSQFRKNFLEILN